MKVPVKGKITSFFGPRINPFSKRKENHNGIDISCYFAELHAPADGIVFEVWEDEINGKAMRLFHPELWLYTGYAHLSKQRLKVGDKVKQGDVFAVSGNSGKSSDPHCHFTVKDKGMNAVNPLLYCRRENFEGKISDQ